MSLWYLSSTICQFKRESLKIHKPLNCIFKVLPIQNVIGSQPLTNVQVQVHKLYLFGFAMFTNLGVTLLSRFQNKCLILHGFCCEIFAQEKFIHMLDSNMWINFSWANFSQQNLCKSGGLISASNVFARFARSPAWFTKFRSQVHHCSRLTMFTRPF